MSVVFMDSAAGGDGASKWDEYGAATNVISAVSPSGRDAYRLGPNGSSLMYTFDSAPAVAKVGFYGRLNNLGVDGSNNHQPFQFRGPTGTVHMCMTVDANGAVRGRLGGGNGSLQVSSANGVISVDTWHFFEIWSSVADSGGRYVVDIDGVNVIDFTGDTRNGGSDTTVGSVYWGRLATGGWNWELSDLRISNDNTMLGPTTVWLHLPDGAGNTTGLSQEPNTGDNFEKVDENPPDGDTTFVYSTTEGDYDLYDLTGLPAGTWDVLAVQTTLNARASDGGSKFIRPVIRSGGSQTVGTSRVLPASYTSIMEVFENNPVTTNPWDAAEIAGLQVGPEVRDS